MSELLEKIAYCVEFGKINQQSPYPPDMKGQVGADELTKEALDSGVGAEDILKKGLVIGMERIGIKFRENKVFVPQVLMSAKAMSTAMEHLKPFFQSGDVKRSGIFIIGTVAGDLHDIGKNLVSMMVEGNGWEVVDLGTDVSAEKFVDAVKNNPGGHIGLSALLTTTMPYMKRVIDEFQDDDDLKDIKMTVGGAPISDIYAEEIGADGYAEDAISAVDIAFRLMDAPA